jgi:hypothetical protein
VTCVPCPSLVMSLIMVLRYRAFISYSHEDLQLARELHEWLESFQIPEGIDGVTNRLAPIFRDEGELSAGQLSQSIEAALLGSEALVVVASEASAQSEWVAKEIQFFRRHAPHRPRLAIIPSRGGRKTTSLAALIPGALLTRRFWGLGRIRASDVFAPEVDKYGTEGAFLRIAAGILKVDFSKLVDRHEQRERRERLKRRRAFASAHAAPLIAAFEEDDWPRLFASGLALIQQSRDSVYGDPAELTREAESFVKDLGLASILLDSAPITAVKLSPGKDRLFLGLDDGTCRLFDTKTSREIQRAQGHTDGITKVSFSPDGARLLTASRDRTARIWDGSTGTEIARLMGAYDIINDAEFSPDGERLVTADQSGCIQLWDAISGQMILRLDVTAPVVKLAFSQNGHIGFALESGEICVFWNATGPEQSELAVHPVFTGKSPAVLIGTPNRVLPSPQPSRTGHSNCSG